MKDHESTQQPSAANSIRWKIHLRSSPEAVYALIAPPVGRARFWADSAEERDGRRGWSEGHVDV